MKKVLIFIITGFFICVTGVQAANLGEQVDFYVDSTYDLYSRSQITTTLKAMGDNIYFYVENAYWDKLSGTYKNGLREELENLADEFDTVIYPKQRAIFGSEWNPGIDNDRRITVLVTQLVNNAGGYFNAFDEYPKSEISSSNEREMIYLNSANIFSSHNKSFLAHEFQHLISFYQKKVLYNIEEEIWLNEARSEYAPTICGYSDVYRNSYLANRVDTFLDNPSDSLTEWQNNVADYGVVSLFMHYLVDHYGVSILTRMMMSSYAGISSINQALTDLGYSERFSDVFADWAVANYLNNCQIGSESEYCYLDNNLTYQRLHADYSASYSGFPNLIVSRSSSIKDWAPYWYQFRQGTPQQTDMDVLKLEFVGSINRGDFQVPYIITDQNNQTTVKFFDLENQQGAVYVPNFTSLNKTVIMIPFNQYKKSGFHNNEPSTSFSFTASSVETAPIVEDDEEEVIDEPIVNYPEGSLIRAKNGYKVYIIKGNYKRWIQSAEIFNAYGHLNWEDIIDIEPEELAQYQDAWLIRASDDKKVYEVNADGTKHWLNMTAEQFTISGRLWDMVYIVNSYERDFYKTSADVLF